MSFLKRLFDKNEEPAQKPHEELHLPFPMQRLAMPEDEIDIEEIWFRYRRKLKAGRQEGFMPVLLHMNDTLLETIQENIPEGASHLSLASVADGKAWLEQTYGELFEDEAEAGEYLYNSVQTPAKGTNCLLSLNQELRSEMPLYLAKIPTEHPWEVLAWLPFGGWNACPAPEDMMAVLKYWNEKYGAVPVCIGSDTLEVYVPEPVRDADALELAKEQYAFCTDIVDQGVGTITALAEELKKSTIWFFWWD